MQATLTLSLAIVNGVGITTTSLLGGYVGQAYSLQCQAAGGFSPYTWSAAGLPAGLTISSGGLISGTPTAVFSGNVTLTVADANG